MRIVVFPEVLRPPSDTVLLVHSSLARPAQTERRLAERGLEPAVVAEHAGRHGPAARERLDCPRSLGVADGSLAERMLVVEGRMPVAVPEPVA